MNDSVIAQRINNGSKVYGPETDSINTTHAKRIRRGIGVRNGGIDWWYANWCGANQGGYENNPRPGAVANVIKQQFYLFTLYNGYTYTRDCRNCIPTKNGLDSACMEHDR